MRIKTILFSICAVVSVTSTAYAQSQKEARQKEARAQLQRAAVGGKAFQVGDTRFAFVPTAEVKKADANTAPSIPTVGGYAIIWSPRVSGSLRTQSATPTASAGDAKLVAAVSESGQPVVATSRVKVFSDDAAAIQRAARVAGGKVVYSSKAAGMASVEFDSVNAALDATARIMGAAGIRGAELEIIQGKEELY